jgi:hypothetical protein
MIQGYPNKPVRNLHERGTLPPAFWASTRPQSAGALRLFERRFGARLFVRIWSGWCPRLPSVMQAAAWAEASIRRWQAPCARP